MITLPSMENIFLDFTYRLARSGFLSLPNLNQTAVGHTTCVKQTIAFKSRAIKSRTKN